METVKKNQVSGSWNVLWARVLVFLKRGRRLMSTIGIWFMGIIFLGLGFWILSLQIGGLADLISPHSLSIGQMTLDGQESKGYAELLKARYDYHLRRPASLAIETGFLGIVTLDSPDLFQADASETKHKEMTLEVKGVDVPKLILMINQLFQPDQWTIEGDFQSQSDKVLLILRLSRGDRIIRTWYLDRRGDLAKDKSKILEQLVDDAIFQLMYDMSNKAEHDADLLKWHNVIKAPEIFPNRDALAAYYEALGALGRYYAHGDWDSLNRAVDCLQALRGLMPRYEDGLQLLGMGLVEQRRDVEAIHVYEQLQLLWDDVNRERTTPQQQRRQLSIDLLKATARVKLNTWQSTHEAVNDLLKLHQTLEPASKELQAKHASRQSDTEIAKEAAAYSELLAHTTVQLSYAYSLYLSYMRHYMVAEMFRHPSVPQDLKITKHEEEVLRSEDGKPKPIVEKLLKKIATHHGEWVKQANAIREVLNTQKSILVDGERRINEIDFLLHLTSGYANYRMAELENSSNTDPGKTLFGTLYKGRLEEAKRNLRDAEAKHPNHYLSLQLLGLVYSELRQKDNSSDLSIAEQYLERAILANPSDYYGHELLADVLYRRAAIGGVDMTDLTMIKRGLAEAQQAATHRDFSGTAYLLQAEFLTMQFSLERDSTKRQELRKDLKQSLEQAKKFLPRTYEANPDLMWVNIVADTLQLGEVIPSPTNTPSMPDDNLFMESKQKVLKNIDDLTAYCTDFAQKWVAHQRVYEVQQLGKRAKLMREEIEKATNTDWREIQIPFRYDEPTVLEPQTDERKV